MMSPAEMTTSGRPNMAPAGACEIETETESDHLHWSSDIAQKKQQPHNWIVEARDGPLVLSKESLAFAIASRAELKSDARIHLVHVITHVSCEDDMIRLPISEVVESTALAMERHVREVILDPLEEFAKLRGADVHILTIRNNDRKAGILQAAQQLLFHRVILTVRPSMFGKRSALSILDALVGAAPPVLPHGAVLLALQGKKILKEISTSAVVQSSASTPGLPHMSPAHSHHSQQQQQQQQQQDADQTSSTPPSTSGPVGGILSSFWRTSSQEISASGSIPASPTSDNNPPSFSPIRVTATSSTSDTSNNRTSSSNAGGMFRRLSSAQSRRDRDEGASSGSGSFQRSQTQPLQKPPLAAPSGSGPGSGPLAARTLASPTASAAAAAAAAASVTPSVRAPAQRTTSPSTAAADAADDAAAAAAAATAAAFVAMDAAIAVSERDARSDPSSHLAYPVLAHFTHQHQHQQYYSTGHKHHQQQQQQQWSQSGPCSAPYDSQSLQLAPELSFVEGSMDGSTFGRPNVSMMSGGSSGIGAFGGGHADQEEGDEERTHSPPPTLSLPPHSLLHVHPAVLSSATGGFSTRNRLFSNGAFAGFSGSLGGLQVAVVQLFGPDWLPVSHGNHAMTSARGEGGGGGGGRGGVSSSPTFSRAAQHRLAPIVHRNVALLAGCCPELRCLVYHRPAGSTTLAARLAAASFSGVTSSNSSSSSSSSGGSSIISSNSSMQRCSSSSSLSSTAGTDSSRSLQCPAKPLTWQSRVRILAQLCRLLTWLHQQSPPVSPSCLSLGTLLISPDDSCQLLLAGVAGLAADPNAMALLLDGESGFGESGTPDAAAATAAAGLSHRKGSVQAPGHAGSTFPSASSPVGSDVFAFGRLILHLLTGWTDRTAVWQLVQVCWAAANIHKAVETVVGTVRQVVHSQPGCDWPEGVLHALATTALECVEECEEWRPVLVGCVLTQVLDMERKAMACW